MDKEFDKVWKLLAAPERWAKHSLANNAEGKAVPPDYESAVQWCLWGAAWKIYGDREALGILERKLERSCVELIIWNNNQETTHTELVETLKRVDV